MNRAVNFLVLVSVAGVYLASKANVPPAPTVAAAPVKTHYSSPNPWSKDEILDEAKAGDWHGEIRLERRAGGRFEALASANGHSFPAVVDTGAETVALPADIARQVGLTWSPDEVAVIGRGASGDVHGVVRHLDSLSVQGMTVRDLEVVVITDGLDEALLGQNFLRHLSGVTLQGEQMVLSNL